MYNSRMMMRRPFLGEVRWTPAPLRARGPYLGRARLGGPTVLTDATFAQALAAPRAVVDFWSPGCPYCVTYKPVFEAVAGEVGSDILMATVDVTENSQAPGPFGIESIPATIFLKDGKEVHRLEGQVTREELVAAIAQVFGSGAAPAAGASAQSKLPTVALVAGGLAVAGLITYFALR